MSGADDLDGEAPAGRCLIVTVEGDAVGRRLDKALLSGLAEVAPEVSRARLQALIEDGAVSLAGRAVATGSAKARAGDYRVDIPPPAPAIPRPEAIPLVVLHEDDHLIVIDKPAGMAAHPAPGSENGTLVNALLHHCADSLSGVGGVARPGIVHRLDKDTSGVMVAAKTDAAHAGLSALFATHDIERTYVALTRGAPLDDRGRVEGPIGRSATDRKKMALGVEGGRRSLTDWTVERRFGAARGGRDRRALAGRIACTLETGRTHQIRVHLASLGAPCLGDPLYGSGTPAHSVREAVVAAGLTRQALHAAVLGFVHPITGERLRFQTPLPADMARLEGLLADL